MNELPIFGAENWIKMKATKSTRDIKLQSRKAPVWCRSKKKNGGNILSRLVYLEKEKASLMFLYIQMSKRYMTTRMIWVNWKDSKWSL